MLFLSFAFGLCAGVGGSFLFVKAASNSAALGSRIDALETRIADLTQDDDPWNARLSEL